MISDAAKEVHVESHVLRYWEEELHLPIRRNELGHRYYTKEDVERFKQIKSMKERGLQLKAIKMILKDGKIDVMMPEAEKEAIRKEEEGRSDDHIQAAVRMEEEHSEMAIDILDSHDTSVAQETKEDKARRLQWLLQQLIRETLQENNKELCSEIKDSVVKELDYQFRAREEREEERDRITVQRNEEYYQRMDELLRKKTRRSRWGQERSSRRKKEEDKREEGKKRETDGKKDRDLQEGNEGADDTTWEELKDVKIAGQPGEKKEKAASVDEKIALKTAQKAAEKASAKAEKGKRKRHSIF